jgi:hypothetical protein
VSGIYDVHESVRQAKELVRAQATSEPLFDTALNAPMETARGYIEVASSVAVALIGFMLVIIGEAAKVFMDIEENTRLAAENALLRQPPANTEA